MTFRLISLYMDSPLSRIYAIIYDGVFRSFPRPACGIKPLPVTDLSCLWFSCLYTHPLYLVVAQVGSQVVGKITGHWFLKSQIILKSIAI